MARMDSDVPHEKNAELMQNAAGGDVEAFESLYRRFRPALRYSLAKRGAKAELCDELVQKIFADLWEKRAHYRAELSFEAYLFGIARNTLRKEMRRPRDFAEKSRKGHPELPTQLFNDLSEPEAELYLRELEGAIAEAVAKLTPGQRQALDAYRAADSPLDKAPEEPGCSRGALNSRLRRARKRLRKLLASFLSDEETRDRS